MYFIDLKLKYVSDPSCAIAVKIVKMKNMIQIIF